MGFAHFTGILGALWFAQTLQTRTRTNKVDTRCGGKQNGGVETRRRVLEGPTIWCIPDLVLFPRLGFHFLAWNWRESVQEQFPIHPKIYVFLILFCSPSE